MFRLSSNSRRGWDKKGFVSNTVYTSSPIMVSSLLFTKMSSCHVNATYPYFASVWTIHIQVKRTLLIACLDSEKNTWAIICQWAASQKWVRCSTIDVTTSHRGCKGISLKNCNSINIQTWFTCFLEDFKKIPMANLSDGSQYLFKKRAI